MYNVIFWKACINLMFILAVGESTRSHGSVGKEGKKCRGECREGKELTTDEEQK
jgi:hypothetical protein